MILLELAAQGIRGAVSASGRATFRPGYVVVPAGGDAFCATISALLWGDSADGDALRATAGHPVRAGATLTTPDRTLYRLVTDFVSEAQLQRYDAGARTFSPAAAGRGAVQEWVRSQTGLPSREAFEDMLCVCAAQLPSRVAAQVRSSAPAPAKPNPEPERIRARLAELREHLRRSRAVDELQRRVDDLHQRLSGMDGILGEGARLRADVEAAEARVRQRDALAAAADELGDLDGRFAAFERASARRDEALARIGDERTALERDSVPAPPIWQLPQLWAGVAAGVAALGVGVASTGALRYVALLDVPAFGWAAWAALRWVSRVEAGERAARRTRVVDERERKALDQWNTEAGPVQRAMAAAGVAEVPALREALAALAAAREARRTAGDALTEWQERPESQQAQRDRPQVESELDAANAELAELANEFVRDVGTLEAEIARLEGELAAEEQPRRGSARAAGTTGEPVADLVRRAGEEIGVADELTLGRVEARASEILAVIAGRRLEHLWADPGGAVVVQPAGGKVGFAQLPVEARDLCWTALKLALVEHALANGSRFAVVDAALDPLPLVARRVAAHILKRAARPGQVLHATADAIFREAADHAA